MPQPNDDKNRDAQKADDSQVDPAEELAYAKRKLLRAAAEIDPLGSVRSHPYMLVGGAALVGGILGASGGAISGLARITASVAGVLKPLAVIGTRAALLKSAAKHTAQAMQTSPSASEHAATAAAYTTAATATSKE